MRCPSHAFQRPHDHTPDAWETRGSDRCCSYCGSWHPDEFLAFLPIAADPAQPGYLDHADKAYKIYIRRPAIANASQGAVKFYKWHLPEMFDPDIQAVYREAIEVSFRKMMAVIDRVSLELQQQQPHDSTQTDHDLQPG